MHPTTYQSSGGINPYKKHSPYTKGKGKIWATNHATSRDATDRSYQNPSSIDASVKDNTYRTVDNSDPLDQGHYESQTLDDRRESNIGQIEVGPGHAAMNGNIYNVTNTINVHVGGEPR